MRNIFDSQEKISNCEKRFWLTRRNLDIGEEIFSLREKKFDLKEKLFDQPDKNFDPGEIKIDPTGHRLKRRHDLSNLADC